MSAPSPSRPSLFSVELRTAQWPELIEWYRNALGLRVLVRVVEDGYALFEAGDTRLAILQRPASGEASGRWSLGFEVVDLDAIHARLLAIGSVSISPKVHPEGFRELIVDDPDGNRIRLFAWSENHSSTCCIFWSIGTDCQSQSEACSVATGSSHSRQKRCSSK